MPKCEPHPTAFQVDVKPAPPFCNSPVATADTYHKAPRGYPASSIMHHPPPFTLDNATCSSANTYHPTTSAAYGEIPSPSEVQLHSWCQSTDTELTASQSEPYDTATASYTADSIFESDLASSVTWWRKKDKNKALVDWEGGLEKKGTSDTKG